MSKVFLTSIMFAAALLVGLAPVEEASAFCGFYVSGADSKLYNDATQVVLMRDGQTTVLSMRNHYSGPPEDFAMVVPVPVVLEKEHVNTLAHDLFDKLDTLTSPRLVEYWRTDPCSVWGYGMGGGGAGYGGRVRIEAQFEVGEYQIVILSADDSMALDGWLRQEKYNIPAGAEAVLKPYVESGMKFFVAKVNLDKVKRDDAGRVVLSPLRFHYESESFNLPVRLGLLNAKGAQDLIIHILARGQRYEVANMPNVTIPTNIEVHDEARKNFGAFYAALFDRTLEKNPGAVVTEYAWDSGSCDPCPGPTLGMQDLTNFGADVVSGGPQSSYVITRLHARYTAAELKDDLVFRAATPIAGGREFYDPPEESGHLYGHPDLLEDGASPSSINSFQARYIIRHPWEGETPECLALEDEEVAVGLSIQWGGKNGGPGIGEAPTEAATNVSFSPREGGATSLDAWIAEDVPSLGLTAKKKRVIQFIPPAIEE